MPASPPDNAYEESVLARYSTAGLRRNQFTRAGKKNWLDYAYPKMSRAERDKILDNLFPEGREHAAPEATVFDHLNSV